MPGKFKTQSQITRIVWSPNANSFYTVRFLKGVNDNGESLQWSGSRCREFFCKKAFPHAITTAYQIDIEGQAAVQENVVPKHLTPPFGDIVRAGASIALTFF